MWNGVFRATARLGGGQFRAVRGRARGFGKPGRSKGLREVRGNRFGGAAPAGERAVDARVVAV
ncbi:MAG: hypothetical protein ACKODX_18325, partial [Gemmata sp.]